MNLGPACKAYDAIHHRQYVKTFYADAALAEKDCIIEELGAELDEALAKAAVVAAQAAR